MTAQITWNVIGIICDPQLEGFDDVITRVQYRCSAEEIVNDEWKYAEKEDWVDLNFNPTQPFIKRTDVTEQIILDWIWNGYINKDEIELQVISQL